MGYKNILVMLIVITHVFSLFSQRIKCIKILDIESKSEVTFSRIGVLENGNIIREIPNENSCFTVSNIIDTLCVSAPGYDDYVLTAERFLKLDTVLLSPEYRTLYPVIVTKSRNKAKYISIGQRKSVTYSQMSLLPNLPVYISFSTIGIKGKLLLQSFEFEINTNSFTINPTLSIAIFRLRKEIDINGIELNDIITQEANGLAAFTDTFQMKKGNVGWYSVDMKNIPIDHGIYILKISVLSDLRATEVNNWSQIHNSKICRYDTNCICLKTNSRKSRFFGPYFEYKYPYRNDPYNYFKTDIIAPRVVLNFKVRKR